MKTLHQTISLYAGGPGSGRHKMLTDLAEKIGQEWNRGRAFNTMSPEHIAGHEKIMKNIKKMLTDAGVTGKELASHISKLGTAVGKRPNVNMLKNIDSREF